MLIPWRKSDYFPNTQMIAILQKNINPFLPIMLKTCQDYIGDIHIFCDNDDKNPSIYAHFQTSKACDFWKV